MIIVGLGNPGKKYVKTYHNVGFMAIDKLSELIKISVSKKELKGYTGSTFSSDERIVLCKPDTFMNLSGECVRELVGRYGEGESNNLIVIVDDIELPLGAIRLRRKGGSGTHNGMRDIVDNIGENFIRIRIGIGKPDNEQMPIMNYVLSTIDNASYELIKKAIDKVADNLAKYIKNKDIDNLERELNNHKIEQ